MKRLYKKHGNIFGVCSGIADYFNIDVSLVRLIFVILAIYSSKMILFYLIASLIMEEDPYEI